MKEQIVAVVPETCVGPGWMNWLVHVYWQEQGGGKIRVESLQPEQYRHSKTIMALFRVSEEAQKELVSAVYRETRKKPALKRRKRGEHE